MTKPKPYDYHPPHIDRMRSFSAHTGMEIADPTERVDAFKQLSVDQFWDILSVSNGLLRDKPRFERWKGVPMQATVGSRNMSAELEPPKDKAVFEAHFKDIQSKLEPTRASINDSAVRLFFGVIGAHSFPDGNGRTARTAFYLMKEGELPDNDTILKRSRGVENISHLMNTKAVVALMKEAGLPDKRIFDREFVGADKPDEFVANYGMTQHLKYLAIARARKASGLVENEIPPSELVLSEQTTAVQEAYPATYEEVKGDWFQRFATDLPLKHLSYCITQIEGIPAMGQTANSEVNQ